MTAFSSSASKRASPWIIVALLSTCTVAYANPTCDDQGSDPGDGNGTITLYGRSTDPCNNWLAEQGLCSRPGSSLSQCIVAERNEGPVLHCALGAIATYRERSTNFTKEVEKVATVTLVQLRQTVCFDFDLEETGLWRFEEFRAFSGGCRLEEIPADCVEDPTSCGAFPVDKRTCEAGWSCAKKVKVSKSSFSPCTEELEQRGMCQIDPQRFWGCFNYVNVGMGNLKCDIRLNLLFADAIELSISRNEKLFYNQSQTICLGFDKPADQFVRVSAMSIVCTDLEDTTENKSLCDVETDLCKEQTLKTLLLQR